MQAADLRQPRLLCLPCWIAMTCYAAAGFVGRLALHRLDIADQLDCEIVEVLDDKLGSMATLSLDLLQGCGYSACQPDYIVDAGDVDPYVKGGRSWNHLLAVEVGFRN